MSISSYRYKDALRGLVDNSEANGTHSGICSQVFAVVKATVRFAGFLGLVICLLTVAVTMAFLGLFAPVVVEHVMGTFLPIFCRTTLKVVGIKIVATNLPEVNCKRGSVIVANHISYIDALVINSLYTAKFVTSEEIRSSSGLGPLTRAGGCIFVERRKKMRLREDLAMTTSILAQGGRLMFFPEGTTGPGAPLLPFKSSLLEAAKRTGASVFVFSLAYPQIDGKPTGSPANDRIAWYGDMMFFSHMWNLLKMKSTICNVDYLGEIKPMTTGTRKAVSEKIVGMIKENLQNKYNYSES